MANLITLKYKIIFFNIKYLDNKIIFLTFATSIKNKMNKLIKKIRNNSFDLDDYEKHIAEIAIWMAENNPSLYIGGSLLLKLKGIDIKRKIHDIDLVTSNEEFDIASCKHPEDFNIDDDMSKMTPGQYGSRRLKSNDGIIIDIIYNEHVYGNCESMLSSVQELINAKFNYINKSAINQKDKCMKDIFNILISQNIHEVIPMSSYLKDIEELITISTNLDLYEEHIIRNLFYELNDTRKCCQTMKWHSIIKYIMQKINVLKN